MSLFKRKRQRPLIVAVLGSGPAGLFAAQAVYDTGNIVEIYARGERSALYGAQYLHEPVPGLDCGERQVVDYILKGTPEGYRRKVYGDGATFAVSPEVLSPRHAAWDIRSAYGHAWDRFSPIMHKVEITTGWLERLVLFKEEFDLVVWSIPLAPFCIGGHGLWSQAVWAQGDAPELDMYCSVAVEPWTVVNNGEDSPRWYRASNVFGHRTAEWPEFPKPPVAGAVKVHKPVTNNCTCWPELGGAPVLRVGRYGTWIKGELSHQAYFRTRSALEAM